MKKLPQMKQFVSERERERERARERDTHTHTPGERELRLKYSKITPKGRCRSTGRFHPISSRTHDLLKRTPAIFW